MDGAASRGHRRRAERGNGGVRMNNQCEDGGIDARDIEPDTIVNKTWQLNFSIIDVLHESDVKFEV
jgi:hypothetical protein